VRVRERCACGSSVDVKGDRPGDAVESWRTDHACDRRAPAVHEQGDAHVERAPVGFTVQP
jgi:hypothetical protein